MTVVLFVGKGNNCYTVTPQELLAFIWNTTYQYTHMISVPAKTSDNGFNMQKVSYISVILSIVDNRVIEVWWCKMCLIEVW